MLTALASTALAEPPLRLPEITVESTPLDLYLPARTEIPRRELVEESQRSELSQVLELAPGINVREGGRGEKRVDVRGFDQRAVLLTLDGVPVYEPYNGIVNLDLFPLEMLQGVEIDRGASSALYGPNGMAGTIKMSSFAPRAPLTGAVSTLWRDSDYWDARASGGISRDRLTAVIAGRYLTSPGFPLSGSFDDRPQSRRRFEDGGLRLNSDRDEKSGFASFGYRFSDQGRLHGAVLGSSAEFGQPPSTTTFAPVFRRTDRQELGHAQIGVDERLAPNVGASAAFFYSSYSTRESQFDGPDFTNRLLGTAADSRELGGIGHLNLDLGARDSLSVGGLVRHADADISDTVSGALAAPDFTTASAAAENVFLLTERLTLVVGLSYDVQTGNGRGTDWELSPQGGLSADLGRYGVARAAISRKIRFPTLRELFDPVQGNPNLSAERTLTYEIGHRLQAERFYLDTSLFRSEVDGLIEAEGSGDEAVAINLQDAVQQGVELAAGVAPVVFARLDVNYTYLDAEARDAQRGFSEIQHKPAHRLNSILRLFLPEHFLLRLEGLYTSDQLDRFGSDVRVGDYALFNARLSKALGEHLDLFAGVDNLLDEDYEDKLGAPRPGRWSYAGVRARY